MSATYIYCESSYGMTCNNPVIQGTKYCENHTCHATVKTTGLPCTKPTKRDTPFCGVHTKREKAEMPIVKVGDYFTEKVVNDRYGYIVTSVSKNGKEVDIISHPGNPGFSNGRITHLRWSRGGYWVNVEEEKTLGRYARSCYIYGVLMNYLDPHF